MGSKTQHKNLIPKACEPLITFPKLLEHERNLVCLENLPMDEVRKGRLNNMHEKSDGGVATSINDCVTCKKWFSSLKP